VEQADPKQKPTTKPKPGKDDNVLLVFVLD